MGNQQTQGLSAEEILSRENIKSLDWETKQKLSSSHVKYNLRIIIKGDRNTGKTCLWRRLQGLPYVEAYTPTPEIQVCNIHWSYKNTDDLIKIEIWDVVDKAKRKKPEGLKLEEGSSDEENSVPPTMPNVDANATGNFTVRRLDATTVDVYKGTHGVIIMIDPTKKWTFEYAQREIENVPKDVYVLLLVNYRDMGEYRVISDNDIRDWVKFQDHPNVKYLDASMKNSFGLKSVITFFNLPFLKLQRSYIEQQLKMNSEEIINVEKEIELVTKEQNYEFYVKWLEQTKKAKGKGSGNSSGASSPLNKSNSVLAQSAPSLNLVKQTSLELSPSTSTNSNTSSPPTPLNRLSSVPNLSNPPPTTKAPQNVPSTHTATTSSPSVPTTTTNNTSATTNSSNASGKTGGGGFFSKLMSRVSGTQQVQEAQVDSKKDLERLKEIAASKKGPTQNIDDFTIGTLDEDFLSDNNISTSNNKFIDNEDSEEETGNPMVIQDEDIEEDIVVVPVKRSNPVPQPQVKATTTTTTSATSTASKSEPVVKKVETTITKTTSPPPTTTITTVVADESVPEDSESELPNPLVNRDDEEEEDNEEDWGSPSVSMSSHFNNTYTAPSTGNIKEEEEEESEEDKPNPLVSRDEEIEEEEEEHVISTKASSTTSPINIQKNSSSSTTSSVVTNNNNNISTSNGSSNSFKANTPSSPVISNSQQNKSIVVSPKNVMRPYVTPIPDDDDDAPNPLVSKFDDEDDDTFATPVATSSAKLLDNGVSLGYDDFEDISEGGFETIDEPQPQPTAKKTSTSSKTKSSSATTKKKMKAKPISETPEEREERKRRHKLKKGGQKKSIVQAPEQQQEDEEEWI